ncbi:hypothetical protein K9N68_37950 (plasmid) [Kovacikia minuta CCNUW1]|uniref:hypothetical protein n=1 Tax=Kovacikia minuta TaxID=2931930 RepID=UPI001CCBAA38|nr:hypothetical protein [Kovacikia minuta]UBF29990.1 hypothetical protein K9N68_37950 [Kovacikia minuta CCNUW1]
MKRFITFVTLALSFVVLILLTPSVSIAATKTDPDYQRYITFHNDFDFPIYPVIQVPTDLCGDPTNGAVNVRRILVNSPGPGMGPGLDNKGLQPGDTITVLIPNEKQTVNVKGVSQVRRCWYQSGRVYIFPVDLFQFEAAMVALDRNNIDQKTKYDNSTYPTVPVTCFQGQRDNQAKGANGNCFTGVAKNSFAADVPAQLAEYTFDSDNADSTGDPDTGTPMADIDVSFVDDLYLPVAASVVNNGATGYMGGAMDLPTFQQQLNNFFTTAPWPKYSAYLSQFQVKVNNALSGLLPPALVEGSGTPAPHLPAGYNSIQNTLSKATSLIYKTGNSAENYLISGVNNEATQVDPYIQRWMWWVGQLNLNDPNLPNEQLTCSADVMNQLNNTSQVNSSSNWPDGIQSSFNKQNFCDRFLTTVKDVWLHFLTDQNDGFNKNTASFYKDCGLSDSTPSEIQKNACIIQHIVGYNSQVLGGELPGQVQALLRGVAYDPTDGSQQYQYDPFLTFAAPYTSQFNLNPFTRLIHSKTDGIGATAYSFSIDDKYGNFRDASSGFMIDAGGTTALENQQPYDPYQQYQLNLSYNRDSFSLIMIQSGTNLASIQPQLQAIAPQYKNRPFLIKQGTNLSVLGHATGTNWKLTQPLVTQAQLQIAADQEKIRTGGATHFYQDIIDYTFGSKSIFPTTPLNVNAPNSQAIGLLDFDLESDWPDGEAILYGYISQQNADASIQGNWVSANVCGVDIAINGSGSQRLPLKFAAGAYQPCSITLKDSFGDAMALKLTLVSKQVTDTYTGASVNVWGLPIGDQFSNSPPITSNLSATDLQYCQNNSTATVSGLCNAINLSAVWAGDPLARDVVYMGLAPKDMPRVNINLPAAPPNPPNPNQVNWPPKATMAFQPQKDGTVLVSWPPAVVGSNKPLQYLLYVQNGASWQPQACDQSQTSCSVKLGASATVYVIAVNNAVSPPSQTPQLFGCYPASTPCPPTKPANSTTNRPSRR